MGAGNLETRLLNIQFVVLVFWSFNTAAPYIFFISSMVDQGFSGDFDLFGTANWMMMLPYIPSNSVGKPSDFAPTLATTQDYNNLGYKAYLGLYPLAFLSKYLTTNSNDSIGG